MELSELAQMDSVWPAPSWDSPLPQMAPSWTTFLHAVEPVEVAVDSGAATGTEPAGAGSGGAGSGGAETEGAEPGGAESGGVEPWGAEPGDAATRGTEPGGAEPGVTEPGGAEPGGAGSARVASRGVSSRREVLSPQELREWFARRWSRAAGAGGTPATTGSGVACPGGAGAAGPGGTTEAAGVGPTGGSAGASGGTGAAGSAGPGATGATGVEVAGGVGAGGSAGAGPSEGAGAGAAGAGGATGAGAPAGSSGAVPAGSGGAPRPRPYFVPLLEQPISPLPAPSPYTGPTGGLAERRAPASRPASPARPACTSRRTSRPRPPAVPGTHQMALRPSTAPLRVPLPSPPASSLPALPDPESDSLRAASPTVACFLATVVTDPSLASSAASALVAELVDFAARCRLDYAASLVAESASVCPPSVGGACALSTDVLEDRQEEFQCFAAALPHLVSTLLAPEGDPDAPDIPTPRSYAEAIEGPYSSQWQAAMDAEMASWKSTGTYVDEVPPPGANIVSGMWIFRVKRPLGSPPVFKARYVARGFSQRQGVDYFHTFSPTPKMTTLRVLLHVAAQRDYELHSLDFSTAFLQGSLHEEIWLRRPPGFTGSFSPGTQSVPPLLPSPTPPCLPCVEGRQRAAPHSSSFPPTTAPLQTLHMDVWGPARVNGQSCKRYFLLVVDDCTRYTTVFPLRSKGQVVDVLIPWIRTVRLQLRERFGQDLLVLRLHSDRGGEFSSSLLRDFCRGEGILQSFTLPDSPQRNGIAERRISLVMEVARTSIIHAAAPHFLWPFAVQYAAHQLNIWPRVSLPETSPTLRWTGKVGDASVFRV
ncbi:unnamed protein product [Closterium sp. NIES-54]